MMTILLIILIIVLLGGGGGYYAHGRYGGAGLGGVLGLVLVVLVVLWLVGAFTSTVGPFPAKAAKSRRIQVRRPMDSHQSRRPCYRTGLMPPVPQTIRKKSDHG